MKRRFSKILGVGLSLALVTSLLLVAAPVSADVSQPTVALDDEDISATTTYAISFKLGEELSATTALETSGTGTADWVTDLPNTGDSCAKLTCSGSSLDQWAAAKVYYGKTLAYLDGLGYDTVATFSVLKVSWSIWYDVGSGTRPYSMLWIDEDADGTVDTRLTGGFGVAVPALGTDETWSDARMRSDAAWQLRKYTAGVIDTYDGGYDGADIVRLDQYLADPDCENAIVSYIGYGYTNASTIAAYVDDIIIDGTTYNLVEPAVNTITITFPEDTTVPETDLGATIQASPGWIRGWWTNATTTDVTFANDEDDLTVIATFSASDEIGEGATVRIEVPGIKNPDDPGDYTLEVETSEETDAVESKVYEIGEPTIDVLPGVIEVRNPANILVGTFTGDTAFEDALDEADEDFTILVGEGSYNGNALDTFDTVDLNGGALADSVTIKGSGDVEDIIWEGAVTINAGTADIVIENITIQGEVIISGNDATFEDCIFEKGDDDSSETLVTYKNTTTVDPVGTIEDCTFDATLENEDDTAIDVDEEGLTIDGCTFTLDEDDIAVDNSSGDADDPTVLSDSTITGGSATGVQVTAGVAEIEGCTFDDLLTAFYISGGTVDIFGGTIQNCEDIAIDVVGAALVTIHNNTITGNDEEVILDVDKDANAEDIFMMFNTITDNAGDDDGVLVLNDDDSLDIELVVANNWWGDVDGPGDDAFGGDGDIVSEPFLSGPITSSALKAGLKEGKTADFEDDVGVQVDNDDDTTAGDTVVDIIGAAQYTTNPVGAIDDAVAFWDVCIIDDDVEPVTAVTIRFYTDVTADTEVWVWGEARGEWLEDEDATPNLFSGFIAVTVGAATTPTLDDLAGLPFAVVEPPAEAELEDDPELLAPDTGATDVSLTPTFAWSGVADADGYYFEFADNANFVTPLVKLDGDLGRLIVTAYAYVTELPYSTAYYWRVKAVSGTEAAGDLKESNWVSGVFITKAEPVEPTPPVVVEPAPPAPIITIEQPDIIVPLPAETPITPAWIYVIIGVGAVLVIGLIVLIVRTRRVA